jgi:hypothetical protein
MIKVTTEIADGNDLKNEFRQYDRHNSFSSEGFDALFDILNDLGEDFELDVIGVDCDFSEDSLENVLNNYSLESFEELQDNTIAVLLDNGNVLYQNY